MNREREGKGEGRSDVLAAVRWQTDWLSSAALELAFYVIPQIGSQFGLSLQVALRETEKRCGGGTVEPSPCSDEIIVSYLT